MEIVISKAAKESALPNESPSRTLSAGADGVICSLRGAAAERDVWGKRVGLDVGLLPMRWYMEIPGIWEYKSGLKSRRTNI